MDHHIVWKIGFVLALGAALLAMPKVAGAWRGYFYEVPVTQYGYATAYGYSYAGAPFYRGFGPPYYSGSGPPYYSGEGPPFVGGYTMPGYSYRPDPGYYGPDDTYW